MIRKLGVAAIASALAGMSLAQAAAARNLPDVQLSQGNALPACTTPGRVMAFLRSRNPQLRDQFDRIAVEYMRHGQELGVRWDYALFQMVVETNTLKFTGDVNYRQNNFAGLGATGNGVPGESFRSVSDGVRAHLQHLMLYAGMPVEDPVADRTRKVRDWRVLDKWRSSFRWPITYSDVGSKWAPNDRGYASDIESVAQSFYGSFCNVADPAPELLAAVGGARPIVEKRYTAAAPAASARASAPQVNPQPRTSAATITRAAPADTTSGQVPPPPGKLTILNGSTPSATASQQTSRDIAAAKFAAPGIQPSTGATADRPAAQRGDRTAAQPAESAGGEKKCRVWTASYGGQKAIIIHSKADQYDNYTVLDVNAGREEQETRAYIAAYAKGGRKIAEFNNPASALDAAFKRCPNG